MKIKAKIKDTLAISDGKIYEVNGDQGIRITDKNGETFSVSLCNLVFIEDKSIKNNNIECPVCKTPLTDADIISNVNGLIYYGCEGCFHTIASDKNGIRLL